MRHPELIASSKEKLREAFFSAAKRSSSDGKSLVVLPASVDGVCASYALSEVFGGKPIFAKKADALRNLLEGNAFVASFGIQPNDSKGKGSDFSLSFGRNAVSDDFKSVFSSEKSVCAALWSLLSPGEISPASRALLTCGAVWKRWRSGAGAHEKHFALLLASTSYIETHGEDASGNAEFAENILALSKFAEESEKSAPACLAEFRSCISDAALEKIAFAEGAMHEAKKKKIPEIPEGYDVAIEKKGVTNLSRLLWILPSPVRSLSNGNRRILIGKAESGGRRVLVGFFPCRFFPVKEPGMGLAPLDFSGERVKKAVSMESFIDMRVGGNIKEVVEAVRNGLFLSAERKSSAEMTTVGADAGF